MNEFMCAALSFSVGSIVGIVAYGKLGGGVPLNALMAAMVGGLAFVLLVVTALGRR